MGTISGTLRSTSQCAESSAIRNSNLLQHSEFSIQHCSEDRRRPTAVVAPKDRDRTSAKPIVNDLGVNRSEVGLMADVAAVVLERRVAIRRQVGRRSVD